MKIPKEISAALRKRTRYAKELNSIDWKISQFIYQNGMENKVKTYDFAGGCEMYVNPEDSEQRIRKVIKSHKEGSN